MDIYVLKNIMNKVLNPDSSVSIDDQKIINSFTDKTDFPYLVSFSRTGSHWLRMIMELYFKRPSLVRTFYFNNASDFTCYHTHDIDLKLRRDSVLYLYRNPVETVYSQLCYYNENTGDQERRQHWTNLYARHLSKWLVHDDFTREKTVITYEGMRKNIADEFTKVCKHLREEFDLRQLESALEKVSKGELKKKTAHDRQVVNLSAEYQKGRTVFIDRYSSQIFSETYSCDPELKNWFRK